ncbi:MAG: arginine--tRNA ligase [Nanoarchaeota archaeon]|nr:arginine--tRNA ligase [Nanoarchaeota archaeon]
MKELIVNQLSKITSISKSEIERLIEVPPNPELGDYAFPCFSLAKILKKNPVEIAKDISKKIVSDKFEKIEAKGPYLNFFVNRNFLALETLSKIKKEKNKYGSSKTGKGKKIVIEMSSPNIAKPFGIGHLRSTIIGNSIANISSSLGFKVIKINYLGDWGTPFGKIMVGYKRFGNYNKLRKDSIKHLYEIYVKVSKDKSMEEEGRQWFKKLEEGDKEAVHLWKQFRELSVKEFKKLYKILNINFDVYSGESEYKNKMSATIEELKEKNLLKESEGALVVNLEEYGLGVCLIKKSDGATLYATRDISAAIDRYKRYKFDKLIYEVGQEQKLHFKQFFKVLELMGYGWGKNCIHVDHGLYLDKDGKKFATRHGKTIFMEDIINETKELAKKEIQKREKLSAKELDSRALKIALAAIFYGDLKNHRSSDMIFDIDRFVAFEGNTGPYILYTYARAKSILRKAKNQPKKYTLSNIEDKEKSLILKLESFQAVVQQAYESLSPNIIANYSYTLAQLFNEFYHSLPVIGSDQESFRLDLVDATSQVLKNSLALLGIETIEKM